MVSLQAFELPPVATDPSFVDPFREIDFLYPQALLIRETAFPSIVKTIR